MQSSSSSSTSSQSSTYRRPIIFDKYICKICGIARNQFSLTDCCHKPLCVDCKANIMSLCSFVAHIQQEEIENNERDKINGSSKPRCFFSCPFPKCNRKYAGTGLQGKRTRKRKLDVPNFRLNSHEEVKGQL
ncbi:hypothetical protein ACOME3_009238 [Neoechinorhynchus agilis]